MDSTLTDELSLTRNPPTHDELLKALLWRFSRGEVDQFVCLCQLAAEFHPEELRKAFAVCLGSDTLVDSCNRAVLIASKAQAKADDVNQRAMRMLDTINDAVNKLDQQIGALFRRLESANNAIDAIAKKVSSLPGAKP